MYRWHAHIYHVHNVVPNGAMPRRNSVCLTGYEPSMVVTCDNDVTTEAAARQQLASSSSPAPACWHGRMLHGYGRRQRGSRGVKRKRDRWMNGNSSSAGSSRYTRTYLLPLPRPPSSSPRREVQQLITQSIGGARMDRRQSSTSNGFSSQRQTKWRRTLPQQQASNRPRRHG